MAHRYNNCKSSRHSVVQCDGQREKKESCGSRKIPFRPSTNPGQLNEVTLGTHMECTDGGIGGYPLFHRQSLDHMSPIRGRTMKEYDQQIVELKNENFNLKLRIYFLEERLQHKFSDSSEDVHKFNIDLKIEVENLKKELNDKHELLMKASSALESVEANHKAEIEELNGKFMSQQCDLEEQICALQQQLNQAEKENTNVGVTQEEDQEELYRQAFLSFRTINPDVKGEVEDLSVKLRKLNDQLSASQTRIQELEKSLADKDAFIKEEEITTVKTHKFMQGILTAIRDKEKQLSQLQEKYELQALELKETKEELNSYLKEAAEVTAPIASSRSSCNSDKSSFDGSTRELRSKDELIKKLRLGINERDTILKNCFKLLGIDSDTMEPSVEEVTNLLKVKLLEKEEMTQSLIEEKVKLLKDKDNEVMKYQERLQEKETLELQLKDELNNTQVTIDELKIKLETRDDKIKELMAVVQGLQEPNRLRKDNKYTSVNDNVQNDTLVKLREENNELKEKCQTKIVFIAQLKTSLELVMVNNSHNKPTNLQLRLLRIEGCENDAQYFEEKLADLEYTLRTSIAKNQLLENQLTAVKDRMSLLRRLVDGIQNGAGDFGKTEMNNSRDLEDNMQAVLRGVKILTNLNNLFCYHIKLNNESQGLSGQKNVNSQMLFDMAFEASQLRCAQCSCQITQKVTDKGGCDGESPLSAMILLRNALLKKVESLQQKVYSTENTVRVLGAKVKYYRKLLQECGQLPPTSTIHSENYENESRCRSVSADDLLLNQTEGKCFAEDNQALSADNVLIMPSSKDTPNNRPSLLNLSKQVNDNLKNYSPNTPDSLLDYGQSSDVLELKEQVCRLKLLLEERESQISEMYSECEVVRSISLGGNPRLSHLSSFLKEQTLTPSDRNSPIDLTRELEISKSMLQRIDTCCQVGDGSLRKVELHNFQNIEDELQWLRNVNAMTQTQLEVLVNELPGGKYASFIQLQQQDISMLKNRLLDSHDACESLRIRLEELAEFLEQLLRFDENGFLDISQFTPQRLESLKRRIAESRELSHSLSHSLLIDVGDISNVVIHPDSTFGLETTQPMISPRLDSTRVSRNLNSKWPLDEMSLNSSISNVDMEVSRPHSEEPTKLTQSSCDDLILLLNPGQNAQKQQISSRNRLNLGEEGNSESNGFLIESSNDNEIRALDEFREQAIMADYVRHYTSRQFVDNEDTRSSYRRISHLSHNRDLDHGRVEYRVKGGLSPSDSESWSEPDRDVSQQRIGLELDEKKFSHERPQFGRSPKSKTIYSSSNIESTSSDQSNTMTSFKNTPSSRRYRNAEMQIENLQKRLQAMIELNNTLRSELKIYQKLEKNNKQQHENGSSGCEEKKKATTEPKVKAILNEHLMEIRTLRLRLEESIRVNDKLQEKLERRLITRHQHIHRNDEEIDSLTLELEDKERMLNDLDHQIRYHLTQCNKQKNIELETQELHHQVADLTEKLQISSTQIQHLEKELISRNEGNQQLKDANQRLQNSISHMQTAFTDKEGVVKELREANTRMQKTLETMDKLLRKQANDFEIINKQKEKLEGDRERESNEFKMLEKNLKGQLVNEKRKSEEIQSKFQELKNAMTHTEEQLEREHGVRLSLQQKLNEAENLVGKEKEKVLELESALKKIEVELSERNSSAIQLQVALSEKENRISKLEEVISRMKKSNGEKMCLLEKQIDVVKVLECKMDGLRDVAAKKEGELEKKIIGLEMVLGRMQKGVKEKITNFQKQESAYEQLQVMLDERSTTIRKLEDELKKVMEENEKLQQHNLLGKASLSETRELNNSLKTELTLYEQFHSKGYFKSPKPSSTPRRVIQGLTYDIDTETLLSEMRRLRTQLELSIQTNNALREQLQENCTGKSGGTSATETTDNEENATVIAGVSSHKRQNRHSWSGFSASCSDSNLPLMKYSSYPSQDSAFTTKKTLPTREQSKSLSDYVSEDSTQNVFEEKSNKKKNVKPKLPTLKITQPLQRSISGHLDSHSIYSSPDLGIESDPSHFSSLEKRMSNITEEHLKDIRNKQQCDKNSKRSTPEKQTKQNTKFSANDRIIYAIGSSNDYDLLKKDLENNLTIVKALQSRVKERLQSCTKTSVKNSEYMTLKELERKLGNLIIGLGKSLKLVSCFWKSMLNSQTVVEAKNPKLLEENMLLKKKLEQQKNNLQDALSKLAASNRLKEGMEKAIMKQLTKTHDVLKRAKGNLEDQANNPKTLEKEIRR